jgi:hypothetical protein
MSKDKIKNHGQDFLNQIAADKIADAEPHFKNFVKEKLDHMIGTKAEQFIKEKYNK